MAQNKTRPTRTSVTKYIAALPDERRRGEARSLVRLLRAATGDPPVMWGPSIIGFGRCKYAYASGRTGEMPRVAFSPRKPALVVYLMPGFEGADALLAKLGPHSRGKACLYIKSLDKIDERVLKMLVARSLVALKRRRAN